MKASRLTFLAFFILISFGLFAQYSSTTVFTSGTEGYTTFRIPAIVILPNGDLLAFAEGRVNGSGDFGDIDLVMKRSSNQGKSWSSLQVVATNEHLQAGNPAPVVDVLDPIWPKGRIFLFYNTGNNHEGEIRKGNGFKQVWYKTSIDNGLSWSDPVDITSSVDLQNKPNINPNWNHTEDWRCYANTPGHAMQFQNGLYKGRIFVAANHSSGNPQPQFTDYAAHGFYTSDHGKSFQLSASVNLPGSNESIAAELSDGSLMMNSRNQKGDIKARIVSTSKNGGQTWDTTYFDNHLPDPVCQGSLLSFTINHNKKFLAFSNAADPKNRDNLTLRTSADNGRTWNKKLVIDNATNEINLKKNDFTAYSDLVQLHKRKLGILYERNNYKEIVFKAIKIKSIK
ncbi:MAG: glycoside hydrolase [Chitinophagaceae bacterium]|nr:glycoside hydrolase [Chitinophagaceae bacterium]